MAKAEGLRRILGSRSRLSIGMRMAGWSYCLVRRTYARIAKLRLDQDERGSHRKS